MFPPPTSFVEVGIIGFCGSMLLAVIGASESPPSSPPDEPHPLAISPRAVAPATSAGMRFAFFMDVLPSMSNSTSGSGSVTHHRKHHCYPGVLQLRSSETLPARRG